jgi:uncharacterized protein (DUF952 family)
MIFHITRAADWAEAAEGGEYRRSTLDRTLAEEGFIHCSTEAQVPATLERFYRGVNDLVCLEIDPGRLGGVEVRWEGEPEAFPHVYGPLPVEAVAAVRPIEAPAP